MASAPWTGCCFFTSGTGSITSRILRSCARKRAGRKDKGVFRFCARLCGSFRPEERLATAVVWRAALRLVYDDPAQRGECMSRPAGTYAIFETSLGNIMVRLLENEAPKTVANFIGLADGTKEFTNEKTEQKEKRPFYHALLFHHLIPHSLIHSAPPH